MADHAASPSPHGQRLSFRGLTFSIRQLLLGTVFVALGCLALRGASEWWVSAMFSLAVAMLTIGALLAVYRQGGQRAFWVGFVVCGAVHLALVIYGWHLYSSENVTKRLSPLATYRTLLTGRLSVWSYEWLYREPEPSAMGESGYGMGMPGMGDMGSMSGGMPGGMPGGYVDGMTPYDGGMESGYDSAMSGGYAPYGYSGMPGSAGPGPGPPAAPPREPPKLADFVNVAHSLWTLIVAAAGGWIALLIYTTGPRRATEEPAR